MLKIISEITLRALINSANEKKITKDDIVTIFNVGENFYMVYEDR